MTGAAFRPEPDTAESWRRRGLSLEAANDLPAALDAYQRALELDPGSMETVRVLAGLAFRRSMWEMAERFYAHLITHGDQETAVVAAYAATLREQSRYAEAIDLLKSVIGQRPEESSLWEGLGTVISATGDWATAITFFDEALRLAPDNLHALFHRGCARFDLGDTRPGLVDVVACARAFTDPDNRASAELTAAYGCLALTDLEAGWRWYEGRHRRGTPGEVLYDLNLPHRSPGQSVAGKRLFVSAEQGLGDEVLYGSLLPDLYAEVAHLGIGVEPRLVSLFQRSFPAAMVVAHRTQTIDGRIHRGFPDLDESQFDLWAVMGDFLASHRSRIADFPARQSFLVPDPARIAHWRSYFADLNARPKIGILWRSLKLTGLRAQQYSRFGQWRDILALPGLQFVNLQYGDASAEMAEARLMGYDIITPEGIDLKDDLDDLAALTCALDVVIAPSNATSNIAAACGVPVWMLNIPHAWPRLGQVDYPWYPSVQSFDAQTVSDWQPALDAIRDALKARFRT